MIPIPPEPIRDDAPRLGWRLAVHPRLPRRAQHRLAALLAEVAR